MISIKHVIDILLVPPPHLRDNWVYPNQEFYDEICPQPDPNFLNLTLSLILQWVSEVH